jgi:peptidase S41-like protein/tricorn protease-like protein
MKHLIKSVAVFTSILLFVMISFCAEELSENEKKFETFWKDFQEQYAKNDLVKESDFERLYNQYRPQVTSETSEVDMYFIQTRASSDMERNLISSKIPGFNDLSNPEKNFEILWKAFDLKYSLFDIKNINWRAIYKVYRPQVNANTSDDELIKIFSSMLGHLNDSHVVLVLEDNSFAFVAGYMQSYSDKYGQEEFFKMMQKDRPMPESYFIQKPKTAENGQVTYGWIANDVGYIHLRCISDFKSIDTIIDELKNASGIVLDIRFNTGGRRWEELAGRFADQKRFYLTTKTRTGPGYSDFDEPEYEYVEPKGPIQFTKNVILLADRTTWSSAECLTLAMRVLPHVTIVGDTTSGHMSGYTNMTLANNWGCSITNMVTTDQNGFCWEGIGIRPDIRQLNSEEDIKNGKDRLTELAIKLIQSGELKPHKGRALEKVQ